MAENWRVETFVGGTVSGTNNVNLAPRGQEESDVYLTVTPGVTIRGEGARLKVDATYAPSAVVYAGSSERNTFYNSLNANARLEAIEQFFFIDARATMSQQFLSPFGSQPRDLGSNTANRSDVYTFGVSPYIRGRFRGGTRYQLRNDSTWVNPSGAGTSSSYYGNTVGLLENTTQRIGWGLDYNRSYSKFENSNSLSNSLVRARLIGRVDPQLTVYASGGYEENDYVLTDESNATYGGGFTWLPTERTDLTANYEYRFFGNSYLASFNHRTRLTAWSLSASRNTSNYPQLALALPPGNTAALLDAIFSARIPDPVARQAAVQQFIQQSGLPAFLAGPQSFYTQQVFLTGPVVGSFAILGARNTITFVASRTYNERISGTTGTPIPDVFAFSNEFTTYLASANWSHRLTPFSTLNLFGSWTRSETEAPTVSTSAQETVNLSWTTQLAPKTNGTLGGWYTIFNTDVGTDYRQAAVFGSLFHRF